MKIAAESMMNPAAAVFMATTPALINAANLASISLKDSSEALRRSSPIPANTGPNHESNMTNSDGAR